jgi:hypothetical protein
MVHDMTQKSPILGGLPRWILAWISFPLSGLVAWLALGPVSSPGLALAAGILVGLGIGAAGAWALRVPVAPWALVSALGLGLGSLLGALAAPLLGGILPVPFVGLASTALAGLGLGVAQAALRPPLPRVAWVALVVGAWIAGWAVSLAAAIDAEQGFAVFGASGALLFTLLVALTVTLAARRARRPAEAAVTA